MTIETEEGANFAAAFHEKFAAPGRTKARRKAERRAGRTAKQRARSRGLPKKQKNMRISDETAAQLKALAGHLCFTETAVIAVAIDALAQKHLGKRG